MEKGIKGASEPMSLRKIFHALTNKLADCPESFG
jgi:hypothetical protein